MKEYFLDSTIEERINHYKERLYGYYEECEEIYEHLNPPYGLMGVYAN